MKLTVTALLLASLALPAAAQTAPKLRAAAPALRLERVVIMMRHGIRPPTKANPVPADVSKETGPSWPVDYGLLTDRGAAGVKLLGEADRAYYTSRGLLGRGCPTVTLKASAKQRAIRTVESWAGGFMSGHRKSVSHPVEDGPDPIFHGLDDEPASFDGQRAWREALATAPRGGIAAENRVWRADLQLLARVLDCPQATCPLLTRPSTLVAAPHDRPGLDGPVDIGSTASQTFLLEYLEGMPMQQVGWGRISRAQIEQLLAFHSLKFKYSNRPDYIARNAAAPLAREILGALTAREGSQMTLLGGHDTNIADLGGFFRVHWKVPSYPMDDVPPGSAIGFELLRDAAGHRYVRAFYRAQTMDQLRNQQKLTARNPAYRQYLAMPACGNSTAERACTLKAFTTMVTTRALP
jgi:4-phytase/acid phosphatase